MDGYIHPKDDRPTTAFDENGISEQHNLSQIVASEARHRTKIASQDLRTDGSNEFKAADEASADGVSSDSRILSYIRVTKVKSIHKGKTP